jgi:hypothetical protein
VNWKQIGDDFEQKYVGCFCRYISPLSMATEVFRIMSVTSYGDAPPDLTLFNSRAGELYLSYTTEAELDFSFPSTGYFQKDDKAYFFTKRYERQWKKGLCNTTGTMRFPYNRFAHVENVEMDADFVEAAFKPLVPIPISNAAKVVLSGDAFSLALNPFFSLGVGSAKDSCWLWYEQDIIAELVGSTLSVHIPLYLQEVSDFVRDTRDNVTVVSVA